MKIVINKCYGAFSVSTAGTLRLREMGNETALAERLKGERYPSGELVDYAYNSHCRDIRRDDADLIRLLDEIGDAANGAHAKLKIVDVPDDISWEIDEHDGMESVSGTHRGWQ